MDFFAIVFHVTYVGLVTFYTTEANEQVAERSGVLGGSKLSNLWVAIQKKPSKAWVKLHKFSITTVGWQCPPCN